VRGRGRDGERARRREGETARGREGERARRREGETARGRDGERARRREGERARRRESERAKRGVREGSERREKMAIQDGKIVLSKISCIVSKEHRTATEANEQNAVSYCECDWVALEPNKKT
jgi:hypothetical protein